MNSSNYYCNSSMLSPTFIFLCPGKNRRPTSPLSLPHCKLNVSWNLETTFVKLTCVISNCNNFRARIFNQIQIPASETSRSLGSRLRRSPLAIRDRLVGKSRAPPRGGWTAGRKASWVSSA